MEDYLKQVQCFLFCLVVFCDSGILNMGGFGIFVYILGIDNDICVRL